MTIRREYRVEARYGHFAVDEYHEDGSCLRTVATGLTKKRATQLANSIVDALFYFRRDNGILDDTGNEV